MTITEIYINYTQYKLYILYTSHTILSSHYSLQRLELNAVLMTSDNARHISHFISRGTQLKALRLRDERRDERRYVCVEGSCREDTMCRIHYDY